MKRKAYSYSRLSTEKQLSGQGLERQQESIKKYVLENNLELIENFEDIGLSGYTGANKKIGKFGTFIRAIEDGEIDNNCTLIVESLDRISRQEVVKAQANFIQLIEAGVEIVTLIDNQKYNSKSIHESPHLLFISLGTMIRANEESEIKSKRLKSSWNKKRNIANDKIMTKRAPAWLEIVDNKFVEKETSYKTIRKIFDLSISRGMGTLGITKYLNENKDKYPPFSTSNKWTKSYVTKILKNPSVHGEFQSHIRQNSIRVKIGEPIKDYYPKVIDEETFQLAQQLMTKRAIGGGGRHAKSFKNIFFKLLKCGNCGDTIGYFNKGTKGGIRLRCYNAHHNNNCNELAFGYEEFEQQFIDYMNEINWLPIIENKKLEKHKKNILGKHAFFSKELLDEESSYDNATNIFFELPAEERNRFLGVLKNHEAKIDTLKNKIQKLKSELIEIEALSITKNDFAIDEIINNIRKSSDVRLKINNHLRSIIKVIKIYNAPFETKLWGMNFDVGLWDKEEFNPRIIRKLEESIPESEINSYINDPKNANVISKLDMHFSVRFKSGTLKETYPNLGNKIEWISDVVAKFQKNFDNKNKN